MGSSTRGYTAVFVVILGTLVLILGAAEGGVTPPDKCLAGASAATDAENIAAARLAVETFCDCAAFDGGAPEKTHGKFMKCVTGIINTKAKAGKLRTQCKSVANGIYSKSTCGFATTPKGDKVPCVKKVAAAPGNVTCAIKPQDTCPTVSSGRYTQVACPQSFFCLDAADSNGDLQINASDSGACTVVPGPILGVTSDIPSSAQPANTPGSPGVDMPYSLLTQFGTKPFSLNNARYTPYRFARLRTKPDAILILVPGFEGGAGNFKILAENLLQRIKHDYSRVIEVWAFDRRTNQLEDTAGLDVAEEYLDPMLGINWLFGSELGLDTDKRLPKRHHAVFYGAQDDVAFLANWTNLVFSQDIDAVVNKGLEKANNQNVFLGGHSMGTVFTTRYASTDFNINPPDCAATTGHPSQPGYAKLRGLVLLEGNGWGFGVSTAGSPLTDDSLDRMIAKFDGGLYGAVRNNGAHGRCVDGTTSCTIANEATDCAGKTPPKCTLPTTSYALVKAGPISLVNPRICAQAEPMGIQAVTDPNAHESITATSGALDAVPDLWALKNGVQPSTVEGGFGTFLDKDSFTASLAPFLAMSLGEPGPWLTPGGAPCSPLGPLGSDVCMLTWKDILHGGSPPSSPVVYGPANAAVNAECTGAATPYACCTGGGAGTCTPNDQCTGAGTPWACCTGAGAGTCNVNAECTGAATPYACCTGAGTGSCTPNARCTGAGTPDTCCTGAGTGTCDVPTGLSNPLHKWGADKEVTRLDRVLSAFFAGKTNFTDWYYPNAGPSTTSVTGVCDSGTGKCTAGNVDASCSVAADCSQAIILDSTQLSSPAGRGRCDIENLTQAANINIPVIGFSGSQGLANVPGVFTPLGKNIGKCTAPSCDGTERVVDEDSPNTAFPTFGDVNGGYEVWVNIGFSHLDVCTAEDTRNDECTGAATPYACCTGTGTGTCVDNNVVKPLSDFIDRNIQ